MKYYLTIKKNEIMPFAAIWMDSDIIILNEMSEKTNIIWLWYHLYVWSKKSYTNGLIYRTETDSQR